MPDQNQADGTSISQIPDQYQQEMARVGDVFN